MDEPIGEATTRTFRVPDVQVDDGAGGVRFATALELAPIKLTVTDHVGAVINGLNAATLLPGHGSYTATTGVLLVTLIAADNPIVSTTLAAGMPERHKAFIHLPGVLWVEIYFSVQNAAGIT